MLTVTSFKEILKKIICFAKHKTSGNLLAMYGQIVLNRILWVFFSLLVHFMQLLLVPLVLAVSTEARISCV